MNLKNSKLLIVSAAILSTAILSIGFSDSYSLSNPFEFSEIMKQKSGFSSITINGESSTAVDPDAAVITLAIDNPPTDLQNAVEQYNENIHNISEELKSELDEFNDVTISSMQTNFDGNYYRYGNPGSVSDSYVAHMSFPIAVDVTKYQNITQEITNLGLQIDDIRISKVPITDPNAEKNPVSEPVIVSVAYDSGRPSCELTNECFLPANITIDAGTEVIWLNDDQAAHTITSGNPENGPTDYFDSGLILQGDSFSYDFDVPGEFPYFCLVHPWMEGYVTVLGDASNLGYELEAKINVRFETKPDTLENTLSAYTKTVDELSALLETNGISGDIPRSTINIDPAFYGRGFSDSYQTYSRWTVKTSLDNLDDVYEILSKYGGVERMYLSHSKLSIDTIRQELTQDALDDARKKAMEVIEPMNLEIKGIKNIKINQDFDQQRYPHMRYDGVFISYDEWNNIRDGNISVIADVEFEVGR